MKNYLVNQKKRVLYVESGMGFGGAMVSLWEMVGSIDCYDPVLMFFSSKADEMGENFSKYKSYYLDAKYTYRHKEEFHRGINIKYKNKAVKLVIGKLYTTLSLMYELYLSNKISRIITMENIDVVHLNNCVYPSIINIARKKKIPIVVHLRGHVDCAGGNKSANKYISKLIAPTKKISDYAVDKLKIDRDIVEIIYDSIDVRSYASSEKAAYIRNKYHVDDTIFLIGAFARIITMKGQLELAKATILLLNKGCKVKCMFVGDESDGGASYLEKLKSYIDDSGFADNFIFTGYQSDIQGFYSAADIVVHPSIEDEAFGRVIIEGWASKKPLIATDIGASVELVSNEETGLIVPVGDIEKLSLAIERLINDKTLREKLSKNGFSHVKKFFDNKITAAKVEKIYDEIYM